MGITLLLLSVLGCLVAAARAAPSTSSPGWKLVVDTDAGADDAVALLMLLGHERRRGHPKVDAVTAVQGNVDLDTALVNIAKILHTAGRQDIPVYAGAKDALVISVPSDNFFGKDGLGDFNYGVNLDPRSTLQKPHAVNALIDIVSKNPGQVTLLALGPLTNIALAIRLDPLFLSKLNHLVVLGGSVEGVGNVLPGIEFNFYADPEAAYVVFNATNKHKNTKPIILVPWETVRNRNTISMDWRVNQLGQVKSKPVQFLNQAERKILKKSGQWSSADPLAAAVTLDPSLVTLTSTEYLKVDPFHSTDSRGAVFVDYQDVLRQPKNVVIVKEVDVEKYAKLILDSLS